MAHQIGPGYGLHESILTLADEFLTRAEPFPARDWVLLTPKEQETYDECKSFSIGSEQWLLWISDSLAITAADRTHSVDRCTIFANLENIKVSASSAAYAMDREQRPERAALLREYAALCKEYMLKVAALTF